jgi:hypothetical protein
MVTFSEDIRYSEALANGKKQEAIMDKVMESMAEGDDWRELDFENIISQL